MEALVRELLEANPGVSEEQIRHYLASRCREYDTNFRSPLTTADPAGHGGHGALRFVSRCHCGKCQLQSDFSDTTGLRPIRCYCSNCRHFHSTSFAAYLPATVNWTGISSIKVHQDSCAAAGAMERFMCGICFTKLGARRVESDGKVMSYLCLGSVEDESIPDHLALDWQSNFEEWHPQSRPAWWDAMPTRPTFARRTERIRGHCACKKCVYEAALLPGEAQHCYCKLCRRLSGSVAQSWVPASLETFRWSSSSSLRLMRTTNHGQRHFCSACGTDLTIVYDSQPDCVWPAAGTLEDSEVLSKAVWYRVIHICCSMMQRWYQLPDDDLPRLKYAG